MEKETSLEEDLELLSEMTLDQGFTYNMRFATVYRSERKKIMHSQTHMAMMLVNMLEKLVKL
jgi:hypothetical protein